MTHIFKEHLLLGNGVTFLLIILSSYASVVIENQWAVNINLIGGAALLGYILFGFRMISVVILAIAVSILLFKQQTNILAVEQTMSIFTCTVGPAISLLIMSSVKKIHISSIMSISFKQILLLSLIQAFFCSVIKLFTGVVLINNVEQADVANYFLTLFTLDLAGTLVIVYCVIKIITYFKKANSLLV